MVFGWTELRDVRGTHWDGKKGAGRQLTARGKTPTPRASIQALHDKREPFGVPRDLGAPVARLPAHFSEDAQEVLTEDPFYLFVIVSALYETAGNVRKVPIVVETDQVSGHVKIVLRTKSQAR